MAAAGDSDDHNVYAQVSVLPTYILCIFY